MALILLLSIAVVTYVAYPHRGRDVPQATWLSDAMRKGVAKLPTLEEHEQEALRRQEQAFLGRR
jgi:hypothetical protein